MTFVNFTSLLHLTLILLCPRREKYIYFILQNILAGSGDILL